MGGKSEKRNRARAGAAAGIVGIAVNTLLCAVKFAVGIISGSMSITADAANNLSDAASSAITLIGFRLSEKRPDEQHPYGHARYEYISGFAIAMLVIVIGAQLLRSGIERIITPQPVEFNAAVAVVLAVSIVAKLILVLYYANVGKRLSSVTLAASAADSRNDCISTAAVLAAAIISSFSGAQLDGIMAAAVACFILASGIGLVRDALDPLLGRAPSPELVESIRKRILSYPGVLGTHDLIVHDYGAGRKFATVHVEMAAENNVLESHDVIDRIERDFLSECGINMLVHFDPVATAPSAASELRRELERAICLIDSRLSVHDLKIITCGGVTKLLFDVCAPHDFFMSSSELCNEAERFMRLTHPEIICEITLDRSFAAIPPEGGVCGR